MLIPEPIVSDLAQKPCALRATSHFSTMARKRQRKGYAWNNVLFYVKGGAAVTGDKYEAFSGRTGRLLASANETRRGGTLGAGLEFGFAQNWSVGVEHDHLFMGSRNVTLTAPLFFETEHIKQDVDIGLARLNYRFGGWGGFGAPVAARY